MMIINKRGGTTVSEEKMFVNICEEYKREKGTLYTSNEKRSLWIYGRIDEKTCADAADVIYKDVCGESAILKTR